jgi:hypothetical protein
MKSTNLGYEWRLGFTSCKDENRRKTKQLTLMLFMLTH